MIRAAVLSLAMASAGVAMVHADATARAPTANEKAITTDALPPKLSDYGFFADMAGQRPVADVTPYRLNTPLFSDGAEKLRFVYLPKGAKLTTGGDTLLDFPVGSALIKTFAFEDKGQRRLIETRVLLHRADGWVALPYLWNDQQTEATLAVAGARVNVTTPRGEAISYRVPNKNQCKECHGLDGAVVPLGPKTRNLSRAWLEGMVKTGHLSAVPAGSDALPLWEARDTVPVEAAARAYLEANCAHCHRPGATASNSGLDLRWEQHDPQAIGIFKRPVAAGRGAGGNLFDIVPGDPDHSILPYRMASPEPGIAMPELGKTTVDIDGVAVVRRWIMEMKPTASAP